MLTAYDESKANATALRFESADEASRRRRARRGVCGGTCDDNSITVNRCRWPSEAQDSQYKEASRGE